MFCHIPCTCRKLEFTSMNPRIFLFPSFKRNWKKFHYMVILEIFWDAILWAFMNLCQLNQVYPDYRDLHSSFDFWNHLVGDPTKTKLSTKDYQQVQCNYHSFGDALRLFLHTSATISTTTCPKSYQQLLLWCLWWLSFSTWSHLLPKPSTIWWISWFLHRYFKVDFSSRQAYFNIL